LDRTGTPAYKDGQAMTIGKGSAIRGWGVALPSRVVTNQDISSILDTTDEWIVERSGIHQRHVASGPFAADPDGAGSTGRLAVQAAAAAVESAGIRPGDVDMVVLCTSTPDKQMPATAALVAGELGIHGGAMDLNAVCAGFLHGLITSASLIGAGVARVLLIGSETMTRTLDWSDRSTAFLFGDGAGALVLEGVDGSGSLMGWDLGVDGTLAHLLYADHGSGMRMKGSEVFRNAVRVTVESANLSMERAGVKAQDIDLFVPHQANARIIESAAQRLGIDQDRTVCTIGSTGNTSSASIPFALVDAVETGRLRPGHLVLLAGFGSGLSWGSAVWQWDGQVVRSPAG
jgi:3-oxoacyl-[acyl-carrier-protein] synthase-3